MSESTQKNRAAAEMLVSGGREGWRERECDEMMNLLAVVQWVCGKTTPPPGGGAAHNKHVTSAASIFCQNNHFKFILLTFCDNYS